MVHHVKNQSDLETKLNEAGGSLVVIDFFATWCGPCKIIAPKLEEMSVEHPDVVFLKVDVDECEDIATEYNISAMPTFVFIKNKEKVDSFSGASVDLLKEKVTQLK
ncbi:Thioredoxin-2 [Frankliniella fusca]|uniref:Thioredoxin n=3 Tax=Arthropoda TaxID=6656 RepID=A0AAE1LKF5_9NEOP|nr:Thioredoxin-2 [Frankliniella fusca]